MIVNIHTAAAWRSDGLANTLELSMQSVLDDDEDVPPVPRILVTSAKASFGLQCVRDLLSEYEQETFAFVGRFRDALRTTQNTMMADVQRYNFHEGQQLLALGDAPALREEFLAQLCAPITAARDRFDAEMRDELNIFFRSFQNHLTASKAVWPQQTSRQLLGLSHMTIKAALRRNGTWAPIEFCGTIGMCRQCYMMRTCVPFNVALFLPVTVESSCLSCCLFYSEMMSLFPQSHNPSPSKL